MPRPNLVRLIADVGQQREDQRGSNDHQRDVGDGRTEDGELSLGLHQDDRLLGVAAAVALDDLRQHEVHELLQHEGHADRGDQERQRAGIAFSQRPVGDELQPDRRRTGHQHREKHCDAEVQHRQRDALVVGVTARGEAQDDVEAEVGAEHAEHEDLGMREVDQPQHTEHQRVADRHQCVDRAPRETVDRQLPEAVSQAFEVEVDVGGQAGVLVDALVNHPGAAPRKYCDHENAPEPCRSRTRLAQ